MMSVCPNCGSERVHVSRGRSLFGRLAYCLGLSTVYCKNCHHRLSEMDNWWDNVRWARCPICYRRDLTDWAEKYLYPRSWERFQVLIGARKHRCRYCRLNFVSFLPRCPHARRRSAGSAGTPETVAARNEAD
ncbi:MAG: hypothetical protein IT168_03180 [Bryobacterales bacterium]|nr:hypothetical protein [Bryobacterales bacterium]